MVAKKKVTKKVVRRAKGKVNLSEKAGITPELVAASTTRKKPERKKTAKRQVRNKVREMYGRAVSAGLLPQPDVTRMSEIAALVSMCGQSGVTSLKMGDIEINFMGRPAIADLPKTPVIVGVQANPDLQSDPLKLTDDDRELFRKSNLLVNDPVEYEREIIDSFTNPEITRHARDESIGH